MVQGEHCRRALARRPQDHMLMLSLACALQECQARSGVTQDYSEFRHLVAPQLRPADRILELGCGNSGLGAALAADGYQHVTCTDLSGVVVERMRRKAAAAASTVQYQVHLLGVRTWCHVALAYSEVVLVNICHLRSTRHF